MTVENDFACGEIPIYENPDALLDLNLFYIRQIGASLQKHVGIQDKLEREIKLRDGASRMLDACTHEDQLLEVAKTLHTSNTRMYTYMTELQRLKTAEIMEKVADDEGFETESKVCNGRVAISDMRIPLMWSDAEKFSGAKVKESNRYAVFCLVRVGSEVQDTELVCMDKTTTDLNFRDVLVFEDATYNFKMNIEIHAFPMAGEPVSAPTSQKLLSRLNRSIGKSEGKRIRDRLKESPATNMKIAPQYEKLGSLTLDITCIDDSIRSHDIAKVILPSSTSARSKPLLPLYGNLTCRLVAQPSCVTDKAMTGFLHSMVCYPHNKSCNSNNKEVFSQEIGKALPCWSYMWCEVKAGKMLCWLNPEDTPHKTAEWTIDLMGKDIKIQEIEKVRQKRSNSFQIRDFENRHVFSSSTKDDMARWIRNLRQHRIDCTAWSKAYLPNKTGASPMFIASPSPFNSPCKLLFDASTRNTSIYKKLSMDSPTRSDSEPVSVCDLIKQSPTAPQPSSAESLRNNQTSAPWAGLFSGALNRSATKVTKLKDVQNTLNGDNTKDVMRTRTRSFDGILTSLRSSKHKKDSSKPPVPRRPSEGKILERQRQYCKTSTCTEQPAKASTLKNSVLSRTYSEACNSDVGLSSDDVFLSSDDNLLQSPDLSKHSGKKKGKKKRKAPLPPLPLQCTLQKSLIHDTNAKASLSSASSLDEVLERKHVPQKPPRSEAVVARFKSNLNNWETDSEGRKSQLSLISNRTQLSNTSSGYKSDSEGLASVPKSPHTNRPNPSWDRHHYEVVILDNDLQARKEKTRIKVLPHVPSSAKSSRLQNRSQSLGSDAILTERDDDSVEHQGVKSFNSSGIAIGAVCSNVSNYLSSHTDQYEDNGSPSSSIRRPIPAPRRSYLTAVESTKVASPGRHLYDEPPDPPNSNEDPNYDDVVCTPAKPTLKSIRTIEKSPSIVKPEPIYARVDKSKKSKQGKSASIDSNWKAQKTRPPVTKQKIDRIVEDTDTVFV